MNVDEEIKQIERRVRLNIERNYLIAMARIEGMTPRQYAAKADAERRSAARDQAAQNAQALGRTIGEMTRSLNDAAENFAIGMRAALGLRGGPR